MANHPARKPPLAPLNRFRITSPDFPGVTFGSIEDLYENASIAVIAKKAIAEFIVDGCEFPLWETLRDRCCWDDESIRAVIANPRVMPTVYYGWPIDYPAASAALLAIAA